MKLKTFHFIPFFAFAILFMSFSKETVYAPKLTNTNLATTGLDEIEMKSIDGKAYSIKELKKANGIVLVFSCNTCPFVVGSETFVGWENQYNQLNEISTNNQFGFALINSNAAKHTGDDSMEEMIAHAKEKKYTVPYLLDENAQLADAFEAKTTPHVFVLNNKMEVVYSGSIDNTIDSKRKKDENYLVEAIQEMNAGKAISVPNTAPRGCSIKRISK